MKTILALLMLFTGAHAAEARTVLTANQYLWVKPAPVGNDTRDCMTPATACATGQRAMNVAQYDLDTHGFTVYIAFSCDTFSGNITSPGPLLGNGRAWLNGCGTGTTVLTASGVGVIDARNASNVWISDIRITNTGSGACIESDTGSAITITTVSNPMRYGKCAGPHLYAHAGGNIDIIKNYIIEDGGESHMHAANNGAIHANGLTITCEGAPHFNSYTAGVGHAFIQMLEGTKFVGCEGVTGVAWMINRSGAIRMGTGKRYAIPGSLPGFPYANGTLDDFGSNGSAFREIKEGVEDTDLMKFGTIIWRSPEASPKTQRLQPCTEDGPYTPVTVKDGLGDAATNPITVTAISSTIDGELAYTINTKRGAVVMQCAGAGDYQIMSEKR